MHLDIILKINLDVIPGLSSEKLKQNLHNWRIFRVFHITWHITLDIIHKILSLDLIRPPVQIGRADLTKKNPHLLAIDEPYGSIEIDTDQEKHLKNDVFCRLSRCHVSSSLRNFSFSPDGYECNSEYPASLLPPPVARYWPYMAAG